MRTVNARQKTLYTILIGRNDESLINLYTNSVVFLLDVLGQEKYCSVSFIHSFIYSVFQIYTKVDIKLVINLTIGTVQNESWQ
jgi:hypothetical protein